MTTTLLAVAGQAGAGRARLARNVAKRVGARLVEQPEAMGRGWGSGGKAPGNSASGGDPRPGVDATALPDEAEYATLIATARLALEAGESVVLSASFHTADSRRKVMRIAAETRSALLFVEVSANPTVRARRLRERWPSQGIVEALLASDQLREPVGSELPRACQMLVDTTVGVDLWAGLASSRLEVFRSAADPVPAEEEALSTG